MTKPSRATSKGREKLVEERAVMLRKPASASSTITASAPPATAMLQRPDATRRAALPIAWVPAAQAVVTVSAGPPRPNLIETAAVAALGMSIGTRNGETRSGPLAMQHAVLVEDRLQTANPGRHDAAGVHVGSLRVRSDARPRPRPSGRRARRGRSAAAPWRCRGGWRQTPRCACSRVRANSAARSTGPRHQRRRS